MGEIWFDPPAALPELLVKYLFTSEKLSVQVHPGDAQVAAGQRGKDECWIIIDAEPGAKLAVGLERPVSETELRAAALDGSIERLLAWHPVAPGDFLYLPAGTIHAIGPGISLIEVQQNSDITYRLYDYGRPRELHLEAALEVARREAHGARWRRRMPAQGDVELVEGPHFRLDRIDGLPDGDTAARYHGRFLLIPLEGTYSIGSQAVPAGSCALVEAIGEIACDRGMALIAQPCG